MPLLDKEHVARFGSFLADFQTPLGLLPKIGVVVAGIAEFAGLYPPVGHKPTALVIYLLVKDNRIVVFEDDPEQAYLIGFTLKDSRLAQMRLRNPTRYTNEFMLDGSDRKPAQVWTDWSLAITRLLFFISWVTIWIAPIAFLAAIFAVQARRESATRKPKAQ